MTAKRGGTRQAPAAAAKAAAAGALASPAEDKTQADALAALVEGTPLVKTLKDAVMAVHEGVAAAKAGGDTPVDGAPGSDTPENPEAAATARAAAIAALTGAPTTPATATTLVVPEVEAIGKHVTWADGDQPLVAAVVAVTSIQGSVGGNRLSAYKGETLHATAEVINRGVVLGALVEV